MYFHVANCISGTSKCINSGLEIYTYNCFHHFLSINYLGALNHTPFLIDATHSQPNVASIVVSACYNL